jgi:hypothetical protein
MKIGILQPGYLPWLGFFEQLYRSDLFVMYDDVQYDKQSWRNRNRIKTAHGTQWLTVPILFKFQNASLVKEVQIDNKQQWKKKHLRAIRLSYSKTPFYKSYIDIFEEAYSREWEYLVDIDLYFIKELADCLGLGDRKIVRSSTLHIGGNRLERLVNICKRFQADTFYEGAAGRNYIDEGYFEKQGITVEYQDYHHPVYKQLYGDFVPYLSVIDLLFNHGDGSLAILTGEEL